MIQPTWGVGGVAPTYGRRTPWVGRAGATVSCAGVGGVAPTYARRTPWVGRTGAVAYVRLR